MHPKTESWSGDALTIASRVNHDLRSPLGAVETTCELLEELTRGGGQSLVQLVGNIGRSAADARRLLESLTMLLRASYGERPPAEKIPSGAIADIVSTRLASLAFQKGTTVSVTGSWPDVEVVSDWLIHLLSALLENAILHGGKRVTLDASEADGKLRIHIDDDGPGFPDFRLADPFPRFEQLHERSGFSGLGLATARRFAEVLEGTLAYERRPTGITRITLTLPVVPAAESRPAAVEKIPGIEDTEELDPALVDRPPDPKDFEVALELTKRLLRCRSVLIFFNEPDENSALACEETVSLDLAFAAGPARIVMDSGNPLTHAPEATGLPTFAGVPLHGMDPGKTIGCLCAIDSHGRVWTEEDLVNLAGFGSMAEKELRLREKRRRLSRALRQMREDQEFNQRILECSMDCIKLLDLDGHLISMNEAGMSLMEIDDFSKVAGGHWPTFWPEPYRSSAAGAIEEAMRGGKGHFQGQCPTAKGNMRWWDVVVSGIHGSDGRIERLLSISRDITASKLSEISAKENEQSLRRVLDRIHAFAGLLTPDGRVIEINAAALKVVGADFAEVAGLHFADGPWWKHSQDEQAGIRRDIQMAASGKAVRRVGTAWTTGDHIIDVEFSLIPILDESGRVTHLVPSGIDLTPRLEAERSSLESERRFRLLADNMSQFAWITEANGDIVWYNRRWFDYTGTTIEDVKGWGWQQVHHPDHVDRVTSRFKECLVSETPWEDTFPLRGKDGEYRWFLSRAIPVRNDEGEVVQWFGTNTDITRLLEVEQALRKASQAKDDFIAVLSHELRTPLNPALLISSAAVARDDLPEDVKRDFDVIRKNIEMEARLIDDLLDMTRILRGKLPLVITTVTVDSLLAETLSVLHNEASAKGLEVETELRARNVCLQGDEIRLRQILWNVMRNAVKFTPAGGKIKVTTRSNETRFIISVEDSGVGVSADELNRIFDPFVQGAQAAGPDRQRYGGLGLGLAIAKLLVEQHGGSIRAVSEGVDRGTLVEIELLLSMKTPAVTIDTPIEHAGSSADMPDGPLRILLIEDHDATRETLSVLLGSRGHTVIQAGCCQEGYRAAQDGPYDLLISDIGLPDGRGDELLARLRGEGFTTPAIALSGYGMEPDVQRSRQAGFSQHLTKPVSIGDLDRALTRIRSRN